MKKIIILILVFNSIVGFSQMQYFVVLKPSIELIQLPSTIPLASITTNNVGLNQLMANNNAGFSDIGVTNCFTDINNSDARGSTTYGNSNLLNALNNYEEAVEIAYPFSWPGPGGSIRVDLVNPNVGTYVGITNNIVQTNNSDLNLIFQNNNVFSYVKNKIISCNNCNGIDLMSALQNLPLIVSNPNPCGYAFLLNDKDFSISDALKIFVKNKTLNIQSDNNDLKLLSVYDLLGKQLIEPTSTNNPIDISNLSTGIYIIKVTENNITKTIKIAL